MKKPDPILQALTEQVTCYQRLAKLAEIQHEHVKDGNTDGLLDVLTRRQDVLAQLSEMERAIAVAKKRWPEYLQGLPVDQRSSAEHLMAETKRLLEQITLADRDDTMVLQQRKITLGRQINQASAARQVNRTYAAAAYGTRPARLDVQR